MAAAKGIGGQVKVTRSPAPKGPILTNIRKKTETLDMILTSAFIMTSYDENKAQDLLRILDENMIMTDQLKQDQLKEILKRGVPDQTDLAILSQLLFDLQDILSTSELPNKLINKITANIPITYINVPFDKQRGLIFRNLLDKIEPKPLNSEKMTAMYEYLDEPPTSQAETFELRSLLFDLVHSNGFQNQPPNVIRDINMSLPIALIGPTEIEVIKGLTFKSDGSPIFNLFNRYPIYDAVAIILLMNYYNGIEFLRTVRNSDDLTYGSPLMKSAREKYVMDLEILRVKIEVIPGTGQFTCRRCHGNNVLYAEKQMRSADEPTSIKLRCVDCDHHWVI